VHNNYFFLKQLAEKLKEQITGWKIGTCFSQERNELIIGIYSGTDEYYIKADQNPDFSCLSFSISFARAKKNSIDLFPAMIDCRIIDVQTYQYERAFSFVLDQDRMLLFKLFGNFSNMLLFEKGKCIDVFRHNLHDEEKIDPSKLDRKIEISPESFRKAGYNPRKLIPAFDQSIMSEIEKRGFPVLDESGKWDLFKEMLKELDTPHYFIISLEEKIKFNLFPEGRILEKSTDPLIAVTHFYYRHQKNHWINLEKKKFLRILNQQLKKHEQYIRNAEIKKAGWKANLDYRQKADIIMANLHLIRPHTREIELFDFYHHEEVTIQLNPDLSPQKNAENLYRKAKNQQKEVEIFENNILRKKKSAALLRKIMQEIGEASDLKTLKGINEKYRIISAPRAKTSNDRFKSYEYMGFRILVGRNARNNDELTFEFGYKDDLWLHAKDVSGSHVLIKYQAGKPFPKPVIEKAGQLAAYFSKNKNNLICPVIYTERKYVRKLKGAPPGTVRVEKENILFAHPADHP